MEEKTSASPPASTCAYVAKHMLAHMNMYAHKHTHTHFTVSRAQLLHPHHAWSDEVIRGNHFSECEAVSHG